MAIELMTPDGSTVYRVNPADKCEVQRRANRRGARWEHEGYCTSPEEARRAVLHLRWQGEGERG